MNIDTWPTQNWQVVKPEDVGMKPENLVDLEMRVNAQYKTITSLLIVRNGSIVFEKYYHGNTAEEPQNVASVTKSFISALIGIAIDQGLIQSVDQKVLDFFPEYKTTPQDFQKRSITIKHLLTMTTPFAWQYKMGYEPLDRLRRQKDWVQFILGLMGSNGQMGKFQYSSAGVHLLSAILTRATGMPAREFANQHLFQPLGMKIIPEPDASNFTLDEVFLKKLKGWMNDPQGNTVGGWGLTITPRDMARFGFLYLNHGLWEGKQIISEQWIADSISSQNNNKDYGYLWWLQVQEDINMYAALGSGGNAICCIPREDLIVIITSPIMSKPRDRWILIEECILPSIIK
ncbi:MAG: serine hydrolase [Anaerolineaceae bacterium]|nr:serine hydrolase [Anaerolineaceae bacterium]